MHTQLQAGPLRLLGARACQNAAAERELLTVVLASWKLTERMPPMSTWNTTGAGARWPSRAICPTCGDSHKHTLRSHVGRQLVTTGPQENDTATAVDSRPLSHWPERSWRTAPRTALRFGIPESSGRRLRHDHRCQVCNCSRRAVTSPSLCYCLGLCQGYLACFWAQAPLQGGNRTWKSSTRDSNCHA